MMLKMNRIMPIFTIMMLLMMVVVERLHIVQACKHKQAQTPLPSSPFYPPETITPGHRADDHPQDHQDRHKRPM